MKRSKMINIIKEKLLDNFPDYKAIDRDLDDFLQYSKQILDLLEEKGMLPPKIKNPELPKDMNKMEHTIMSALYDNDITDEYISPKFEVNEWEKE